MKSTFNVSALMNLRDAAKSGKSKALKDVHTAINTLQLKVNEMVEQGIRPTHILKMLNGEMANIKTAYTKNTEQEALASAKVVDRFLKQWERSQNSDTALKNLHFQRWSVKYRAMSNEELADYAKSYSDNQDQFQVDELDIIAGELKGRGLEHEYDAFRTDLMTNQYRTPFAKDPEYQEADRAVRTYTEQKEGRVIVDTDRGLAYDIDTFINAEGQFEDIGEVKVLE